MDNQLYDNLSVPLFVSGYMKVMDTEKPAIRALMAIHLDDLMGDTELYRSEEVRAFHTIWLQQMKWGRMSWTYQDINLKMTFRCSLV